jgi:hypothetical protein
MPDNRYMQWPLNPIQGNLFTSETGSSWVFDGCGWVSTCCPPTIPCDPERDGISVIYSILEGVFIKGYGVSYFTWNSNLDRYEGYLIDGPAIIYWTGFQWRFKFSNNTNTVATSATSNILDAVWNMLAPFDEKYVIEQVECGLIYNQLCLSIDQSSTPTGSAPRGPFTLYPSDYDSIVDIMNGSQPIRYNGEDSNGNTVNLYYDSTDAIWYMSDDYGNYWEITANPNQNALILGGPWTDQNNDVDATFDQGTCDTECYPERDGITLVYNDGDGWTPIYLTWNSIDEYYFSENPYINELWGWNWVRVQYNGSSLEISIDVGPGSQVIGENGYNGSFDTTLFNESWPEAFNVFCGDVGCTRMCASFNGNTTTMVPYWYDTIDSLLNCTNKFNGWVGWNGTNEVIYLNWNGGTSEYKIDIDGNGLQLIPVTSHTTAALVANSPYAYNQTGLSGILTLTSGDC